MDCRERVINTLNHSSVDRPPLFDTITNDKVISYYAKEELTIDNARTVMARAFDKCIDSTRQEIITPQSEEVVQGERGEIWKKARWTSWRIEKPCETDKGFEEYLKDSIDELSNWDEEDQANLDKQVDAYFEWEGRMKETVLFANFMTKTGCSIYPLPGLEIFSYTIYDNPDLLSTYFDAMTEYSVTRVKNLKSVNYPAVFVCEDISYKGSLLFSPEFLRKHFFPRLEKIIDAYHQRGLKFIFHSDGNIMPVLGDLVAVGIDGLNPLEVIAGVNIGEIRRRYPDLLLFGGIDTSQLLAFGTPKDVKKATLKAIEQGSPGYFVGSSTEIHDKVPLDNFKTIVNTVKEYTY